MRAARLLAGQLGYVNKTFWRNPMAAFFTFALPLMFLVIFTSLVGTFEIHLGPSTVRSSSYYVPAMAAFAVITACFNSTASAVTAQRDAGILKRIRRSPLPAVSFLGARIAHAMLVAVLLVAITVAFGHGFYHAEVPSGLALLRFLVALISGAASFCALGLAVTAIIPNADASAAIINAVILPLLFLSGIFIPFGNGTPAWVTWVARLFPVRHFADSMQAAFLGTAFAWSDVLIVLAWGAAGMLAAVRFFRWQPR